MTGEKQKNYIQAMKRFADRSENTEKAALKNIKHDLYIFKQERMYVQAKRENKVFSHCKSTLFSFV